MALAEGDERAGSLSRRLFAGMHLLPATTPSWKQVLPATRSGHVPGPGLGYMLAGGSDESNTDPTASGPADGEEWVTTPAHLMLMVPWRL